MTPAAGPPDLPGVVTEAGTEVDVEQEQARPRRLLLLAIPLLLAAIGVPFAITRLSGSAGGAAGTMPLDLASVSTEIAGHYHSAEQHRHAYRMIPCFCGCEKFLGHRNLYDCFVRSDGQGWDSHAAGCGVCTAESVTARKLLAEGEKPADVRDAVIAEFGTTPGTTPPSP